MQLILKFRSSHANFFANQKTVGTLISFWQVICVLTNLIRLETVKKRVYLDKARQRGIQGRGPGGSGPLLFLDQTEARRAEKIFL